MTFRKFFVPLEKEWIDKLGIESTPLEDEETVREVLLINDDLNLLRFTYDIRGYSIRLIWLTKGLTILDIFREGATLLKIDKSPITSHLAIEFETDELSGNLVVHLTPELRIKDSLQSSKIST